MTRNVASARPEQAPIYGTKKNRQGIGKDFAMKNPSIMHWYHILRVHHQFAMFQAIRYALWLSR